MFFCLTLQKPEQPVTVKPAMPLQLPQCKVNIFLDIIAWSIENSARLSAIPGTACSFPVPFPEELFYE